MEKSWLYIHIQFYITQLNKTFLLLLLAILLMENINHQTNGEKPTNVSGWDPLKNDGVRQIGSSSQLLGNMYTIISVYNCDIYIYG